MKGTFQMTAESEITKPKQQINPSRKLLQPLEEGRPSSLQTSPSPKNTPFTLSLLRPLHDFLLELFTGERTKSCPPHTVMISLPWSYPGFILIGLFRFFPGTLKFMNGKDQSDSETGLLPNINLSCHMLMQLGSLHPMV